MDILTIIFGVLFISFFSAYILTVKKFKALNAHVAQILLFYQMIKDDELTKDENDIHKENFIKFLSDSREWAFSYIEEVQQGLKKFIEEIEPEIEYYNSYGIVIEGMVPPHDKALKKISEEFKELKKLLPQDENA